MYYSGGEQDAYSYAILTYTLAFGIVPLFLIAAIVVFLLARKTKSHKKLLYVISIFAVILSLIFGLVIAQGKPRCCGEGITYKVMKIDQA